MHCLILGAQIVLLAGFSATHVCSATPDAPGSATAVGGCFRQSYGPGHALSAQARRAGDDVGGGGAGGHRRRPHPRHVQEAAGRWQPHGAALVAEGAQVLLRRSTALHGAKDSHQLMLPCMPVATRYLLNPRSNSTVRMQVVGSCLGSRLGVVTNQ